mmetsp:Transcript_54093/g.161935  ORF Transcript_54093/g.161935 Transcript_54093/m.161935 type:complete len:234 (+) Transcript_54093:1021-1722(+)
MLIRTLEEDSARLRVAALLHEGEFVLSQRHLAHFPSVAQLLRVHVLDGVDGGSTARAGQPLHVAPLGATEAKDTLLGENVQREGIDPLLVDHDKTLSLLAHRSLEIHHLPAPFVEPLPLTLHELLPLLGARVKEPRLHLRLLILERHVARHDMAVHQDLGHVGMSPPMVEHNAVHEPRVSAHLLLHRHDFDHVQVDGEGSVLGPLLLLGGDTPDGVDDRLGHALGELVIELGF